MDQRSSNVTDRVFDEIEAAQPGERVLAVSSAFTGLAALISGAACCVLPLALAAFGIGSGALGFLVAYHWPLTIAALIILTLAWVFHLRISRSCAMDNCEASSRIKTTRIVLIAATVVILISASWELFEQPLMRWIGGT
jgi:mercuric ion transport protein